MTSKLFSVVGITSHNGNAKVRFTDDLVRRVKQFTAGGATRCDFVTLPEPMTKLDALNHMLTVPQFASDADQATINDAIEDRTVQSKRSGVKVSLSLDAIKARSKTQAESATVADVLEAVVSN
jgi:hypothetical protein